MQNIQEYLGKVKKKIVKQKKEGDFINQQIRAVLEKDFNNPLVFKYLKAVYLKKTTLVIETTNKVFAQELFWRKEDLKNKINAHQQLIKAIVVK